MADKYAGNTFFGKNWQMTMQTPRGSTIWLKSLSHTVTKIDALNGDFQDDHQKWCGNDFWKKMLDDCNTLGVKKFVKITITTKINMPLCFMQKFKMAAKNCGKTIFGKSWLMTLCIPWRSSKLLYLAVFPR